MMHGSGDILVVEDDAAIADFITEVLQDEGYAVRTTSNGAQALLALRERRPALVLLDAHMPGMSGLAFLGQLQDLGISDLSVVPMTADPQASAEFATYGLSLYLAKPFDLDDLLDCVARFLSPENPPRS